MVSPHLVISNGMTTRRKEQEPFNKRARALLLLRCASSFDLLPLLLLLFPWIRSNNSRGGTTTRRLQLEEDAEVVRQIECYPGRKRDLTSSVVPCSPQIYKKKSVIQIGNVIPTPDFRLTSNRKPSALRLSVVRPSARKSAIASHGHHNRGRQSDLPFGCFSTFVGLPSHDGAAAAAGSSPRAGGPDAGGRERDRVPHGKERRLKEGKASWGSELVPRRRGEGRTDGK